MELVRFYAFVIKIAFLLALAGQIKGCTHELLGLAASKHEMLSYSRYTKMLVGK